MASPEAAASPWVQEEIGWWLANRSASNILILLTDGEIQWRASVADFDWEKSTALPPNLKGQFRNEPLWVDLRWARSEEKLSPRNSEFQGAISYIAAALLGRPKEDLHGDDIRAHRRNQLAAYTAVIVSLSLAAIAIYGQYAARLNATSRS